MIICKKIKFPRSGSRPCTLSSDGIQILREPWSCPGIPSRKEVRATRSKCLHRLFNNLKYVLSREGLNANQIEFFMARGTSICHLAGCNLYGTTWRPGMANPRGYFEIGIQIK